MQSEFNLLARSPVDLISLAHHGLIFATTTENCVYKHVYVGMHSVVTFASEHDICAAAWNQSIGTDATI